MQKVSFGGLASNGQVVSTKFDKQSHHEISDNSLSLMTNKKDFRFTVDESFLRESKESYIRRYFRRTMGSGQTWGVSDSRKAFAVRRKRLVLIPFFLSLSILCIIFLYIQAQVANFAPLLEYSRSKSVKDPILLGRSSSAPSSTGNSYATRQGTPARVVTIVENDNVVEDFTKVVKLENATTIPISATKRLMFESISSSIGRDRSPVVSEDTANDYNLTEYTAPTKPYRPQKHMVPSPLNLSNATHNATKEDCQPILDWQTRSYPTCNMFHEIDMTYTAEDEGNEFYYLGHGTIRDVWDVSLAATGDPRSSYVSGVVLKTLRLTSGPGRGTSTDLSFSPHRQETHRRDAVVSERLSSSPHVVDIYGYCAQSCLNEKLDESLVEYRRHIIEKHADPLEILKLARDAAAALRDVHSVDYDRAGYVTIVHKDVTHRNLLMSSDGKTLKITDFNLALFPLWDTVADAPCGLRKNDCTTYRSPEECRGDVLDEKIDVYMLGNTMYYILTKKQPLWRVRIEAAKRRIEAGEPSAIPPKYIASDHPAHKVLIDVIQQCWTMNSKDRPSAAELATLLSNKYNDIVSNSSKMP